jgi:hypothetical protein
MAQMTSTTITGVSILAKRRSRHTDVFDITLSHDGINIKRPGRSELHMAWDRVAQWEIEEQPDCVVLTLRGDGSVTPLVVPGWTLDDLEVVMREVTSGVTGAQRVPPVAAAAPAAMPEAAATAGPEPTSGPDTGPRSAASPESRAERRRRRRRQVARSGWRTAVTVILLCALATAVTLVLLQSAGVISWGFLGPTA